MLSEWIIYMLTALWAQIPLFSRVSLTYIVSQEGSKTNMTCKHRKEICSLYILMHYAVNPGPMHSHLEKICGTSSASSLVLGCLSRNVLMAVTAGSPIRTLWHFFLLISNDLMFKWKESMNWSYHHRKIKQNYFM